MQYILSEEEYSKIKTDSSAAKINADQRINKLVDVAIFEGELKCIHNNKHSSLYTDYCDDCPLDEFCSKPKDFSQ